MYKNIIQYEDFGNFIRSNAASLIYFSTPGCNVCKVLKPKLQEFITEHFPLIKTAYIDCEKSKELAAQNRIFTVPVILIFFEGREFIRKTRNVNIAELKNELSRPYNMLFD